MDRLLYNSNRFVRKLLRSMFTVELFIFQFYPGCYFWKILLSVEDRVRAVQLRRMTWGHQHLLELDKQDLYMYVYSSHVH